MKGHEFSNKISVSYKTDSCQFQGQYFIQKYEAIERLLKYVAANYCGK